MSIFRNGFFKNIPPYWSAGGHRTRLVVNRFFVIKEIFSGNKKKRNHNLNMEKYVCDSVAPLYFPMLKASSNKVFFLTLFRVQKIVPSTFRRRIIMFWESSWIWIKWWNKIESILWIRFSIWRKKRLLFRNIKVFIM